VSHRAANPILSRRRSGRWGRAAAGVPTRDSDDAGGKLAAAGVATAGQAGRNCTARRAVRFPSPSAARRRAGVNSSVFGTAGCGVLDRAFSRRLRRGLFGGNQLPVRNLEGWTAPAEGSFGRRFRPRIIARQPSRRPVAWPRTRALVVLWARGGKRQRVCREAQRRGRRCWAAFLSDLGLSETVPAFSTSRPKHGMAHHWAYFAEQKEKECYHPLSFLEPEWYH